ncbi:hypothetical protein [Streptomyces sp. NPDC087300]|uniref:hypothetical protein n=1 Tax=Streptomyces sp. NPDC087300 TaxID=3365780 RepID=UPI003809D355
MTDPRIPAPRASALITCLGRVLVLGARPSIRTTDDRRVDSAIWQLTVRGSAPYCPHMSPWLPADERKARTPRHSGPALKAFGGAQRHASRTHGQRGAALCQFWRPRADGLRTTARGRCTAHRLTAEVSA